jgi:TRAP transporter TAXI family solute receptor
VVKSAAIGGIISLAGCAGGGTSSGGDADTEASGDGDTEASGDGGTEASGDGGTPEEYQLVLGGSPSGTYTQTAGQALARAANEESDFVSISVQESSGWGAHPYVFESGELSAFGIDNNTLSEAMNDQGQFSEDPVSELPMQGFYYTNLDIYWVAVEGSDITSTADIADGGHNIHPIQPGFGSRNLAEKVIKNAGMWEQNEIVNIDATDVAGAIEEGRIDALCVYGNNGKSLAGWIEEVDVRHEGDIYAIEVDETFQQAIEDTNGASLKEMEPYGWNQDITSVTDTVQSWVLYGQWAFGPSVPAEVTYELARVANEHHDVVLEADQTAVDNSNVDNMTQAVIPDLAVHPGIADYWEENGAWNDEWTRGEADQ